MQLPDFLIDHPDGEIRLTGHRIGLYHVVAAYQDGSSPEAIRERFPTLPIDLIDAVIAFYRENRVEVDAYVAGYRADLRRQRENAPLAGPSLAELRRRLEAMRRENVR